MSEEKNGKAGPEIRYMPDNADETGTPGPAIVDHGPPPKEGDVQLGFITDEHGRRGVIMVSPEGARLFSMEIEGTITEARKRQIVQLLQDLYRACKGALQPSGLILPARD